MIIYIFWNALNLKYNFILKEYLHINFRHLLIDFMNLTIITKYSAKTDFNVTYNNIFINIIYTC